MASKNFYELLKLDPSETDRTQIERVIERHRQEWVRWADNPAREGESRLYLGLLPNIRKVLLDPSFESQRRAQAEEYRNQRALDATKLDDRLFLAAGKELRILESRFTELLSSFAKTFASLPSEQQIRERCKTLGISIVSDETLPEEPDLLDRVTYRDIESNLRIAEENDLYAMLKVPFGLKDRKRLLAAADGLLKTARLYPNDAAWEARAALAGQCLALFTSDLMQRRYDRTAQHATIGRTLNPLIDQAAQDGVLTYHEWHYLLKKAADAGIHRDIAERYITQRVNVRAAGHSSAKLDTHIKAAYEAVDKHDLPSAMDALDRVRSLQSDHPDIAILERRIRERQQLGQADAALRRAIVADTSERSIAAAAHHRAAITTTPLAPSDNARVTEARLRVQLLDTLSPLLTGASQADDEAFMSLWEQSPDAATRLSGSRDPECRKLSTLAADARRRLKQLRLLQIAAETADRHHAKEVELLPIASELPQGYRHRMEPRLAMSAALMRTPPDAAATVDAWLRLKAAEYNVQECHFRDHCEELAKTYTARTVLEPLLDVANEASDRRYLRAWDQYSFGSAQLDSRFEQRMRDARTRVDILTQLQAVIAQVDATLSHEATIVSAASGLPPYFHYDLELRVALAQALTAVPQSDLRIADLWIKLRAHPDHATPPDTIQRCELAVLRRDTLLTLRSLSVGIATEYDRQFVTLWHHAELENVRDAEDLQPAFSTADACVAAETAFENLAHNEPPGLTGEDQWVQISKRLPPGYRHPWALRVELALALTSSPISESRVADIWARLAGSSLAPSDAALQHRCHIAVKRSAGINRLRAMDSSRAPQELRDKTFVDVWDNALFEGCDEADRWREEASEALLRGRELMDLEQALRDGVDYIKIQRLAASPRLRRHHSVLEQYTPQIDAARSQAELMEQIQQCVREGRVQDCFNAFEASGTFRDHKALTFHWPELGDFVRRWWQSRLNMKLGSRDYVVSPDRRQLYITWTFAAPELDTWFEVATTNDRHPDDLYDQRIRQRTQKISIAELAAMGGRLSLPAPAPGQSLFVTIWAVADCADHILVSEPLTIGPITSVHRTREAPRRSSWKSYLWKLLNN